MTLNTIDKAVRTQDQPDERDGVRVLRGPLREQDMRDEGKPARVAFGA